MRRTAVSLLSLGCLLAASIAGAAEFDYSASLKFLGDYSAQTVTESSANVENVLLDLPGRRYGAEARGDFSLDWWRLRLFAKPRVYWSEEKWTLGRDEGRVESDLETKFIEGGLRVEFADWLYGYCARENLQWGPGQFLSPSNPFFTQNGRGNKMRELPGMDFARLVWVPSAKLTVSYLGAMGRGEAEGGISGWRASQALKVDYTGNEANGALIAHIGSHVPFSVRGYGQWTATDAVLLYGEFSVADGNRIPYPVEDGGPTGGHMEPKYRDGGEIIPVALLGGSYTFAAGPTVSLEYLYNGNGYTGGEAELLRSIAEKYGPLIIEHNLPAAGAGGLGEMPLRRNYLFAQYLQSEIFGSVSAILRCAVNLDDRGSAVSGYLDWALSDHFTLYGYGALYLGTNSQEYGMSLRNLVGIGVEWAVF